MKYKEIKLFARQLRNNPTPAEKVLWRYLKGRQLENRKFLRQHPIIFDHIKSESFCFIPDFFCYQEGLAIELDGPVHELRLDRDHRKDAILEHLGICVLRIQNEEMVNIQAVLEKIKSHFKNQPFHR